MDSTEFQAVDPITLEAVDDPTAVDVLEPPTVEALDQEKIKALDSETLRLCLSDTDPVIEAAAFQELSDRDKDSALEALLDVVNDTTNPVRLQALQLLLSNPNIGKETLMTTFRAALQDPDSSFVVNAIQELAGRSDAESLSALEEGFRNGDPSTRLWIIRSVASNISAAPLIQQGLKDSDERVRQAATAILFPSKDTSTADGQGTL